MNILYASKSKIQYSVNAVYIEGLRQCGIAITPFQVIKGVAGYLRLVRYFIINRHRFDLFMVGYESPGLAILLRILSTKKVIYNALCSVYERLIVSRSIAPVISFKSFRYWLLDFIAMHCASIIMLESQNQIEYCKKLFKVSPDKLHLARTGVDDKRFAPKPKITKFSKFTVIFRGRFLPEAGVEYVVEAAKLLDKEPDIHFIVFGSGPESPAFEKALNLYRPSNLEFIIDPGPGVSGDDWIDMVRKCHLSLGQLSDHPRLERTIPHKAYETLALGLPYLTAANKAILELLINGETCITCIPANANDLAQKILLSKENSEQLDKIASNGHEFFKKNLTPPILAGNLIDKLKCTKP